MNINYSPYSSDDFSYDCICTTNAVYDVPGSTSPSFTSCIWRANSLTPLSPMPRKSESKTRHFLSDTHVYILVVCVHVCVSVCLIWLAVPVISLLSTYCLLNFVSTISLLSIFLSQLCFHRVVHQVVVYIGILFPFHLLCFCIIMLLYFLIFSFCICTVSISFVCLEKS